MYLYTSHRLLVLYMENQIYDFTKTTMNHQSDNEFQTRVQTLRLEKEREWSFEDVGNSQRSLGDCQSSLGWVDWFW